MQRYVILEEDRVAATVFAPVGGDRLGQVLADDAVLSMPEIEIELPLGALYPGLIFDAANNGDAENGRRENALQLGQNCPDVLRYSPAVTSRRVRI